MSEEPTTPDLEELSRRSIEAAGHRDFDGTLAPFAPDGMWDMFHEVQGFTSWDAAPEAVGLEA